MKVQKNLAYFNTKDTTLNTRVLDAQNFIDMKVIIDYALF